MALHIPIIAALVGVGVAVKTAVDVLDEGKGFKEALWENTKGGLRIGTQVVSLGMVDPNKGFDFDNKGHYLGINGAQNNKKLA